jgi:hypothetical protein
MRRNNPKGESSNLEDHQQRTSESVVDPLLSEDEAARVVGSATSTLKQSRHTGMLFGRPAPRFRLMGKSPRYLLSTLHKFRNQFPDYANTSEYQSGIKTNDE